MPLIRLTTFIAAPAERVFDLARSVNLHKKSMNRYREECLSGKTSGLMELNDDVTWKAKHLFKQRILQTRITAFKRPELFIDEQVKGDFVRMKHEHYFKSIENGTLMIDQFCFETPYGFAGKWLNALYLEKYIEKLLLERNSHIKQVAESNLWKQYLDL